MPIITVTTTITTTFSVPEGVTIEMVRHQALPDLSEDEEITDSVLHAQDRAMNQVYLGDATSEALTVEHKISEGIA